MGRLSTILPMLVADSFQVQESPQVVKSNWELERVQRRQKKEAEAAHLLGYYVSVLLRLSKIY